MTTTIAIVNFGPRAVKLYVGNNMGEQTGALQTVTVYPQQVSQHIVLHDSQSVLVEEVKE